MTTDQLLAHYLLLGLLEEGDDIESFRIARTEEGLDYVTVTRYPSDPVIVRISRVSAFDAAVDVVLEVIERRREEEEEMWVPEAAE